MIDVLAFGAHPDDIEFGCGGILAKLAAQGRTLMMCDLTLGDKGTGGNPAIRKLEAENSATVIGAKRIFLNFNDCEVIDSYEGRLKLVEVIRTYKPKLVLAPQWKGEQNHPDHLGCGLMARYACRYARFAKILPHLPAHKPDGILHYLYPTYEDADFLIDISDYVESWKKMMECHQSQLQVNDYVDMNMRRSSRLGVLIGKGYAQGLIKGNPIEIDDLMSISKGSREI